MEEQGIKEEIIQCDYFGFDEDLDEEQKKTLSSSFYKTKDKNYSAYLKAIGQPFYGVEKVLVTNIHGKKKKVIVLCFDKSARRKILEYHNSDSPNVHNVNAKLILTELRNINSIIANY